MLLVHHLLSPFQLCGLFLNSSLPQPVWFAGFFSLEGVGEPAGTSDSIFSCVPFITAVGRHSPKSLHRR